MRIDSSVLRYGAMNLQLKRKVRHDRGEREYSWSTKYDKAPVSLWDQYFASEHGSPEAIELLQQIRNSSPAH